MDIVRKLKLKDAQLMLEWMHDDEIIKNFSVDFKKYVLEDAQKFILGSFSENNQHFALVDENDVYLGTISLKNISHYNKNAELNSVFCRGVEKKIIEKGIKHVIDYAVKKLNLEELYIHLFEQNKDLIEFYESIGFKKGGTFINPFYIQNKPQKLCWYYLRMDERNKENKHSALLFKEMGDKRGHMVVIEGLKDIPFDIKRIFYMYGSSNDSVRGMHANRNSEFVLINVSGKSKIRTFDGDEEVIYELTQPHMGVYIPKMIWKEMYDFSDDSVLLVLSSELYDADEYIRDKEKYIEIIRNKGGAKRWK